MSLSSAVDSNGGSIHNHFQSGADEDGKPNSIVLRSSQFLDMSEVELRAALTQEQIKCASLTTKFEELKRQSSEATVQAEVEEEFLTNRLLRQLTEKLKENELLSVRIEDDVANVESLKQKLHKVRREKVHLENRVEALQENFVNRSLRRATSEERTTFKSGLSDSSWCSKPTLPVGTHTELTPAPSTGSGSACGRSRSRKTSRPLDADCHTEYLLNNMSAAADDLTKWLCSSELDGVNACIDEMNGLESYLMKLIQDGHHNSADVVHCINPQQSGDFSNTFNRLLGIENRKKDVQSFLTTNNTAAVHDVPTYAAKHWSSFKGVIGADAPHSGFRKCADVSTAADSSGHRSTCYLDDIAQLGTSSCNTAATDCSVDDATRGRSDTSAPLPSRRFASAPQGYRRAAGGSAYSAGGSHASTDGHHLGLELEEELCATSTVVTPHTTGGTETNKPTGDTITGTSNNGLYLQPVAENIKDWDSEVDEVDVDKQSSVAVKYLIDSLLNYIEGRRRTLQRRKEKILLHATKSPTPTVGDGPPTHVARLNTSPPNLAVLHMQQQQATPEQQHMPTATSSPLEVTKEGFLAAQSADAAVSSASSAASSRQLMHSSSVVDNKCPTIDELCCLPEIDGDDTDDEQ